MLRAGRQKRRSGQPGGDHVRDRPAAPHAHVGPQMLGGGRAARALAGGAPLLTRRGAARAAQVVRWRSRPGCPAAAFGCRPAPGRRYLSAESISLVLAGRYEHTDKDIKEEVPELQAATAADHSPTIRVPSSYTTSRYLTGRAC